MDHQLLTLMTVFVGIAAVALVLQLATLFGIYKAARGLQENVQKLMPKVEGLIDTSRQTLVDARKQIADITSKTSEILEITRRQVDRVDTFLEDATTRARIQFDRAESVLDDAMTRAQRTVAVVEGGIVKPVLQIQGLAAGLKTALTFLLRGRPNPLDAHSDEEMFI